MLSMATRALFETLQKVEHHIKTGYSVLDVTYSNDVIPTQGTGQGNDNGPTVWGLISTKMIVMMKKQRTWCQTLIINFTCTY